MNPTDSGTNKTVSTLPQDVYRDERRLLIDEEREAARTFDKAMLTLTGGALGLSLTFIRQLAPHPHLTGLLVAAWSGLTLALLATIAGLHLSQHACRRNRDNLDDDQRGVPNALGRRNPWAKLTNCLNWVAMLTFASGIALLAWFAIINLSTPQSGG